MGQLEITALARQVLGPIPLGVFVYVAIDERIIDGEARSVASVFTSTNQASAVGMPGQIAIRSASAPIVRVPGDPTDPVTAAGVRALEELERRLSSELAQKVIDDAAAAQQAAIDAAAQKEASDLADAKLSAARTAAAAREVP